MSGQKRTREGNEDGALEGSTGNKKVKTNGASNDVAKAANKTKKARLRKAAQKGLCWHQLPEKPSGAGFIFSFGHSSMAREACFELHDFLIDCAKRLYPGTIEEIARKDLENWDHKVAEKNKQRTEKEAAEAVGENGVQTEAEPNSAVDTRDIDEHKKTQSGDARMNGVEASIDHELRLSKCEKKWLAFYEPDSNSGYAGKGSKFSKKSCSTFCTLPTGMDPTKILEAALREAYVPTEEARRSLGDEAATTPRRKFRFLKKIIPIHAFCESNEEAIKQTAAEQVKKYFPEDTTKTFGIIYKAKSAMKRKNIIDYVAKDVVSEKYRVDLSAPDIAILVDAHQKFCGISVIREIDYFRRFSLSDLEQYGVKDKWKQFSRFDPEMIKKREQEKKVKAATKMKLEGLKEGEGKGEAEMKMDEVSDA